MSRVSVGGGEFSARTVFRRKSCLSPRYVPAALPHRQVYLDMLRNLFSDFLERPRECCEKVVQVYGPTGSGKSCTVLRFGMDFERDARLRGIPLKFVHVNSKLGVDSAYALYQTILQRISPESAGRGYSPSEMLRQIMFHLKRAGEYLLLAVDDADYLVRVLKERRGESGVVFDLTRLNEMFPEGPQHVVGVIFIAKDPSFRSLLDPAEVSSLGSVILRVPSYTSEQLAEILAGRVEEAFRPGAVSWEVVEFTADLAASKSYNPGDCRFALDVLLAAGLIADSQWSDRVTLDHVRMAASEWFDGISTEDLASLDTHEALVLLAAAKALDALKAPYVSIKEIHEYYVAECEDRGLKPRSCDKVREHVEKLHYMGIVNLTQKGVCVVGAPVRDLSRLLAAMRRGEQIDW